MLKKERDKNIEYFINREMINPFHAQEDLDTARAIHIQSLPEDAPSRLKGLSESDTLEAVFKRIAIIKFEGYF